MVDKIEHIFEKAIRSAKIDMERFRSGIYGKTLDSIVNMAETYAVNSLYRDRISDEYKEYYMRIYKDELLMVIRYPSKEERLIGGW